MILFLFPLLYVELNDSSYDEMAIIPFVKLIFFPIFYFSFPKFKAIISDTWIWPHAAFKTLESWNSGVPPMYGIRPRAWVLIFHNPSMGILRENDSNFIITLRKFMNLFLIYFWNYFLRLMTRNLRY